MRVLHIAELATIRVLKESFSMQQARIPTAVWYKACFHKGIMGLITQQSTWNDYMQLQQKIKGAQWFDIVHVHTTCNNANLVKHVAEAVKDRAKVVWDIHDWSPDVPTLAPLSDSIIVPSEGYADMLGKLGHTSAIVYSMLPKALFQDLPTSKVNAGILVSGIESPSGMVWRDYTEAQKQLNAELFIYAGIDPCVDGPHPLNAHYENILTVAPYMGMMRQLSKYSFGYAGAANSRHTIHDCVTNKFWEYIAAGLPIITFNSDEMSKIVKDQWSGIALDALDQPWKTPPRKHLNKARYKFTMESQIPKLKQAYTE
jgi:hypothetical protein